jgi:predicted transposase YdaD
VILPLGCWVNLSQSVIETGLDQSSSTEGNMQQSVIYQEWREEFLQEGEAKLVLRLLTLTLRMGAVAPEVRSQIQTLSFPKLEALAEELLEFSAPSDLTNWLQANCPD